MNPRSLLLYVCFFVSGASALFYECVWQRLLTLVFGLSTLSVAAVVSAFLAGLAVGAWSFAGWADRANRPVLLYAGIELGIAVTGLASGFCVPLVMAAFHWIYGAVEPGWLVSNLIRFVLAFVAFGIPSVLIGATVPVMARLTADRAGTVAVGFGRFYAVNTAGSVAGAALAGFVLIRALGVDNTLHCAVLLNVVVALIAVIVGRSSPASRAAPPKIEPRADTPHKPLEGPKHGRFALAAAVVTGAVGLGYEVAWTRLVAVYTYNSVYVFTMVVTVYLAALACGAAMAAYVLRCNTPSRPVSGRFPVDRFDTAFASDQSGANRMLRWLAGSQIGLALIAPLTVWLAPAAAGLNLTDPGVTSTQVFWLEYAVAAAVVFVPALLSGLALPLLVGVLTSGPTRAGSVEPLKTSLVESPGSVAPSSGATSAAGRVVGRMYAWNSVGTILGAGVTGALLVPLFGLRGTLLGLAAVNFLVAAAAAGLDRNPPPRWRTATLVAAGVFVMLVAVTPANTRFYRSSGLENETVLYYAEGPSATVHVAEILDEEGTHRTLFVDSKSVAGTYDEIVTDQKMLAHLPLLLHPSPERVLTVGFGSGGTSYSMLQHGVRVDCAEIEPKVPQAYRLFDSENHGLVGPNHERVDFHLVLDDARAWLQVAPVRYDAIVTDVTSLQYRGNGNLYTTDYFRLMRDRLTPDGLGCAWVPASGITPEQLKILIRSFREVYPHTSVWYILNLPTDFVILVGTPGPLAIRLDQVEARMSQPRVQRDLQHIGMADPYKLAACLLLAEDDVAAYLGDGPLHTDDRPVLDYLSHADTFRKTLSVNLRKMMRHRSDAARYITAWPDGMPAEQAGPFWKRWYEAAGHLLEGHVAVYGDDPDRTERVREAYEAAAALVPEDAFTRTLADGMKGGS